MGPADIGEDDRTLDADVATRIMGYRWVEWNHAALGGAPIDEPGRFLVAPDDPISHLHIPAASKTSLNEGAFARVPRFSRVLDDAFAAASAAGLFSEGGAVVSRSDEAGWTVEVAAAGREFTGADLPELLCRAALAWAAAAPRGSQ